ncbi:MAG: hypothetical protein AB7Q37_13955 [Pyrinomonadaceae bacterium]
MVKKDYLILAVIVCAAIGVRVLAIWVGRPEFVGWFSHTYYYFVQTQSVLVDGSLAFSDLPLIFYLYAAIAKLQTVFGVEPRTAILSSTRLVMTIVPALIALPIYSLVRAVGREKKLSILQWLVVAASAFLPLTIAQLPEILQKNMLGLVLFGCLQAAVYRALRLYTHRAGAIIVLLTGVIFLTHLGTFAAVLFFFAAIGIAFLLNEGFSRTVLLGLLLILAGAVVSGLSLYLIDSSRFERIIYYIGHSLYNSQLGKLFVSQSGLERLQFLAGIVGTALISTLFFLLYRRAQPELAREDRIFWLGNIILLYLLLFPMIDVDLLVRFLVFASIPLLVIQMYLLAHITNRWIKRTFVIVFAVVCLVTGFGEVMGVLVRNGQNRIVQAELFSIQDRRLFGPNDLIITKYSVNPLCNWFFSTRSGLITSLNLSDFAKYENVFILNPNEGEMTPEVAERLRNREIISEVDRYEVTRNNIIVPAAGALILKTDNLEIYRIEGPPNEWTFDRSGRWTGYLAKEENDPL